MELFGNNKELKRKLEVCGERILYLENKTEDSERVLRQKELDNKLRREELENDHAIALKEKEFEMKHLKDEEIKKAQDEVIEISKELAVLKKENEMLKSITDVNADIIDVKDLVSKLVEKLPSIDLKSLTINNTDKK